ncbi:JUND factor, partial [Corythaixoides concolor]|nr:JUND factor [Corythaixoides concolor]
RGPRRRQKCVCARARAGLRPVLPARPPPSPPAPGAALRPVPSSLPPLRPRSPAAGRGRRMETPFYHDDVLSGLGSGFAPSSGSSGLLLPFPGGSMMKKDALGMALPEQVAAALKAPGAAASGEAAGLLGSAELGLLKLASPELERLIIQSNGLVTTTPTSGQFLYPKAAASEEQEFAEGFVKALEDLHKQNQLGGGAAGSGGGGGGGGGG